MFRTIIIGYIVIGILIPVVQNKLSDIFEQKCNGIAEYTLLEYYRSCSQLEILEKKCNDDGILYPATGVVMWLPNLWKNLIAGDMTVKDYLVGGYKCTPVNLPKLPPIVNSLSGNLLKNAEELESTINSGSLAEQILNQPTYTTISPFTGITLEIPQGWQRINQGEIDEKISQSGFNGILSSKAYAQSPKNPPVSIMVSHMPPVFNSAEEIKNLSNEDLQSNVQQVIKGMTDNLTQSGMTIEKVSDPKINVTDKMLTSTFEIVLSNSQGEKWTVDEIYTTSAKQTISIEFMSIGSPPKFEAIFDHIKSTYKIS